MNVPPPPSSWNDKIGSCAGGTMNVLVVYDSFCGHNLKMARAARDGVPSVSGVEAVFRRAAGGTIKLRG